MQSKRFVYDFFYTNTHYFDLSQMLNKINCFSDESAAIPPNILPLLQDCSDAEIISLLNSVLGGASFVAAAPVAPAPVAPAAPVVPVPANPSVPCPPNAVQPIPLAVQQSVPSIAYVPPSPYGTISNQVPAYIDAETAALIQFAQNNYPHYEQTLSSGQRPQPAAPCNC